MENVVGIFRSRIDADAAVDALLAQGIPREKLTFLTPEASQKELAQVPTTDANVRALGRPSAA